MTAGDGTFSGREKVPRPFSFFRWSSAYVCRFHFRKLYGSAAGCRRAAGLPPARRAHRTTASYFRPAVRDGLKVSTLPPIAVLWRPGASLAGFQGMPGAPVSALLVVALPAILLTRLSPDGRHDAGLGIVRQVRPCLEQFEQIGVVWDGIARKCVGKCVALTIEPRISRGIRALFGSPRG